LQDVPAIAYFYAGLERVLALTLSDESSTYQMAIAPHYFVPSFRAGVATQHKFIRQLDTVRDINPHAAIGLIHHNAIVRC